MGHQQHRSRTIQIRDDIPESPSTSGTRFNSPATQCRDASTANHDRKSGFSHRLSNQSPRSWAGQTNQLESDTLPTVTPIGKFRKGATSGRLHNIMTYSRQGNDVMSRLRVKNPASEDADGIKRKP